MSDLKIYAVCFFGSLAVYGFTWLLVNFFGWLFDKIIK